MTMSNSIKWLCQMCVCVCTSGVMCRLLTPSCPLWLLVVAWTTDLCWTQITQFWNEFDLYGFDISYVHMCVHYLCCLHLLHYLCGNASLSRGRRIRFRVIRVKWALYTETDRPKTSNYCITCLDSQTETHLHIKEYNWNSTVQNVLRLSIWTWVQLYENIL